MSIVDAKPSRKNKNLESNDVNQLYQLKLKECERVGGRKLDLSNLAMSELPEEIKSYNLLKYLSLRKNNFTSLPDHVLAPFRVLELLDLSRVC